MHYTAFDHYILVVLAAIAAFLPRIIPLRIFTSKEIPSWFNAWMKYVPVSLFTSLVVRDLFINTHNYTFTGFHHMGKILSALIVMVVAYRTRSMGLSVLVGLITVALFTVGLHW